MSRRDQRGAGTPVSGTGPEDGAHPGSEDATVGGVNWLAGDGRLARWIGRPLSDFARLEASSAVLLALAVAAGLFWANSPWRGGYVSLWATEVAVKVGPLQFDESLRAVVNDAAMVLFFFVVGLEIKREMVTGSLRHPKAVALPVAAAIGGMLVPAGLYALINLGSGGERGWAIPMATDVALAVGVLVLAGPAASRSLTAFLLTLAVVDDIGVIVVIAVFYSSHVDFAWLALSVALLALVVVMRQLRIWYVPAYVVVGTAVWYAMFRSGVHATIAGVALGLLTPARPLHPRRAVRDLERAIGDAVGVRHAGFLLRESVPVAERLQQSVQPWVSFAVLPLFALANAGIVVDAASLGHAFTSRVGVGVLVARLVGKPLGIIAFSWLALRAGLARLPGDLRWPHLSWAGVLGAVGFTVSVYVASLSFAEGDADTVAKIAILTASLVAAGAAGVGLRVARRWASPPGGEQRAWR